MITDSDCDTPKVFNRGTAVCENLSSFSQAMHPKTFEPAYEIFFTYVQVSP